MCGDNQLEIEKGIEKEQIIAYVSEVYRKEKRVNMRGFGYRSYVFWWTKMPIRWCAFFPRRAARKIKKIFGGLFGKGA
jgi:hypothetical protein